MGDGPKRLVPQMPTSLRKARDISLGSSLGTNRVQGLPEPVAGLSTLPVQLCQGARDF